MKKNNTHFRHFISLISLLQSWGMRVSYVRLFILHILHSNLLHSTFCSFSSAGLHFWVIVSHIFYPPPQKLRHVILCYEDLFFNVLPESFPFWILPLDTCISPANMHTCMHTYHTIPYHTISYLWKYVLMKNVHSFAWNTRTPRSCRSLKSCSNSKSDLWDWLGRTSSGSLRSPSDKQKFEELEANTPMSPMKSLWKAFHHLSPRFSKWNEKRSCGTITLRIAADCRRVITLGHLTCWHGW